jgi:hypothetical protein
LLNLCPLHAFFQAVESLLESQFDLLMLGIEEYLILTFKVEFKLLHLGLR